MEERPAYSYSFRDPFSPKSSDDFHDVFGGPPRRRSSLHERPPLSSDFPRTSRGSRDEVLSVRRHWSGSGGEKPAFGEASNSGSGRRRNLNLGEEFYSDIFPGSDSAGSTPKRDGLSLSSNPGSRVLSPNRSVKGKYDGGSGGGAGGGLSLPAQGSLSFRFSHDTVSEANLSTPSSPSSTAQNPKSNVPSPFPSRLRSSNSGNYQNALAGNFHFSFYRWAGKGATLKTGSVAEIVIQGDEVLSVDEDENMLEESVKSDITEESGINTQKEFNRNESKSRLKNLQQLFMDENIPNQVDTQMDEKKEKNNKNKQKSDLETDISEEKITGRKTKGKLVREFMKRFNYEGSPKHHKVENENKRRKDKDQNNKNNNQNQFTNISSNSSVQNDEEIEITKSAKMSVEDAYFFASSHMDEVQENNEEIKTEKDKNEEFSAEKNEILDPDTDSEVPDPVADSFNNSESHFDDFEACLVEESIEDQNQNNTEQDQIKISEGKIRNWSKGKEGNIRSLLSTLHYVLWEGSGWKPVPLMDIIEVPAVRKSYQKALLCLHPDKLQQRGAKPHQKYIAEKVFDILQEAWNLFSL